MPEFLPVNVYRLITRGTLEEKIMGLQKFKLYTANSIISSDNSSLLSMATSQVRHDGITCMLDSTVPKTYLVHRDDGAKG